MTTINLANQNNLIRVTFSNRGLSRVFSVPENVSTGTPDGATLVNISNMLSDVAIATSNPTSFSSVKEFLGIDYVGYIIDKERLDTATGNWIRTDEYSIIGSQAAEFKDSRVAYGYIYRYRIRSVVKVTLPILVSSTNPLTAQTNLISSESDSIKNQLLSLNTVLANINNITNVGLQSKTSQGVQFTNLPLVDGLSITASPSGMMVTQTPPSTLSGRKKGTTNLSNLNVPVASQGLTSGQISTNDLQRIINSSLQDFLDKNISYESFYFASEVSKNWKYVPIIETEPPPPPSAIKIIPNTPQGTITVTWLPPSDAFADISAIRVYRKKNIGDVWSLLLEDKEILVDATGMSENGVFTQSSTNSSLNIFVDNNVDVNSTYIYALTSINVHGFESVLSTQIQAQLNPRFAVEGVEKPLKWISGSGALPTEIGTIYKKFIDQEAPIIVAKNISIAPAVDLAETKKNLVIRVTSLDTHESKDIVLTLKNLIIGN